MAEPDPDASSRAQNAAERIVYMYPPGPAGPNDDIDLRVIWRALVRDRWILILLSLLGLAGAASYAWLAPSWYRAEVRLLPEAFGGRSPLGTQTATLGELADLAMNIPGASRKNEPLATLGSSEFARRFVTDEGLVESVSGLLGARPDVETAVGIFAGRVRSISEDQKTGIITLRIDWKDAATAADLANRLAASFNRFSREAAIAEASANVTFLRGQMAESQDDAQRQVIGRLLESELQKLVVAKGRDEFAFRIIDKARPPGGPHLPRARLVMAAGLMGGFMLALAVVFVRSMSRRPGE